MVASRMKWSIVAMFLVLLLVFIKPSAASYNDDDSPDESYSSSSQTESESGSSSASKRRCKSSRSFDSSSRSESSSQDGSPYNSDHDSFSGSVESASSDCDSEESGERKFLSLFVPWPWRLSMCPPVCTCAVPRWLSSYLVPLNTSQGDCRPLKESCDDPHDHDHYKCGCQLKVNDRPANLTTAAEYANATFVCLNDGFNPPLPTNISSIFVVKPLGNPLTNYFYETLMLCHFSMSS